MLTDFPIQRILDRLVERIVDVLPIDAAGVTLISPGIQPRYVAASDDAALRYETLQSKIGEGPCVLAFESGEPVSVPDLRSEDRFPSFTPEALTAGLVAVFTFPLRHGDRPLGALDLYRNSSGSMSEEALAMAQTLADVASAYLLNAQAREDLIDSASVSREASLHDPLTGLPNRVLVMDRIEHALQRSRRSGTLSAVFFLDLDRFKAVNDMYGHKVGDQLLVGVADRLTHLLRPGDTLARLSGDEFVVLCEGLESPDQAVAVAGRLDDGLDLPFRIGGHAITVNTSVGVAFADSDHHDPEQILHNADTAMYLAKHAGGDRLRVFDSGDDQSEVKLEHDLRMTLAAGVDLRTEYQPIVATSTGEVMGFEALLRWDHPTRGPIPASVTIPVAERSGLIVDVGRWVLDQACASWSRWRRMLDGAPLSITVNVSPHELMSAGYVESVASAMRAVGTELDWLILDVTESVFALDQPRALIVLSDLKELGVTLAVDDFGIGSSSLGCLRDCPLDLLKINGEFIAGLGDDVSTDEIMAALVQLAHALGMEVIAECVETADQREHVARMGCEWSQGFYFARPMTPESIDWLIEKSGGAGLRLPRPTGSPTSLTLLEG